MQASKIMPKKVYATYDPPQGGPKPSRLVRFFVDSVVTYRTGSSGSPHDYTSKIVGYVEQPDQLDLPPDATYDVVKERGARRLDPKDILGPYEEYAELAERKRQEVELRRLQDNEKTAIRQEVCRLLHVVTGAPMPSDPQSGDLFAMGYSRVEINQGGAAVLLPILRDLAQRQENGRPADQVIAEREEAS